MEPPLPTGTVTFLFTDIEGSTRLLSELGPEPYAVALAEHRRTLREAFTARGGVEVDTQGDAFFVAFASASGALEAAAAAQAGLASGPISVRMGIHTGNPVVTGEGYVGMDVHKGARIAAAAHGGQVVVSDAARALAGVELRPLGAHRLKDLSAPEPLWQLGEDEFPPLKSLNQTNLPLQPTPLVGRERELAEATELLRESRLVTLLGPGGSGKTRLALQVAADVVDEFAHGVWWVPLQAIEDPALVEGAIGTVLGAREELAAAVGDKRLLLLLDNFEQVAPAAPAVAELLAAAPNLRILVTSREPLRIAAERRYAVPPLPLGEARALFVERARAVDPAFAPTPEIEAICRRLDCLPLAIELAAARVALLAPDQLLRRLEQRLPLLTGGAREAPARQQTLRATIEWSHGLLSAHEQQLFARLAVFAGSFELEAAEAVAAADVATLQSLVEKSLVRRWGSGRFGMLETIAEFARERLEAADEAGEIRRAHARWFCELAARADLRGPDHAEWLKRLTSDRPNLRAALEQLARDDEAEAELRLASDLAEFFFLTGALLEGRRLLEDALARAADVPDAVRARALAFASMNATLGGDLAEGMRVARSAVEVARAVGDPLVLAESLRALGAAHGAVGETADEQRVYDEALEIARTHGFAALAGDIANNLGYSALVRGELHRAEELLAESIAAAWRRDDVVLRSFSLANLALAQLRGGRGAAAASSSAEALRLALEHELTGAVPSALVVASWLLLDEGDAATAARLLGAISALEQDVGDYGDVELELFARARADVAAALGEEASRALAEGAAAGDAAWGEALRWLEVRKHA